MSEIPKNPEANTPSVETNSPENPKLVTNAGGSALGMAVVVELTPVSNSNGYNQPPDSPSGHDSVQDSRGIDSDQPVPVILVEAVSNPTETQPSPVDEKFVKDYLKRSKIIEQKISEIAGLGSRKDFYNRHLAVEKEEELALLKKEFHDKFFKGIDPTDKTAMNTREQEIYDFMKADRGQKIAAVEQQKEIVAAACEELDASIEEYQTETDPAKADKLWGKLEKAYEKYNEMAANFNLKNDALSGLVGTPLFEAMGPAIEIAKATVRDNNTLGSEDEKYLHILPTSADKKAAKAAAKTAAKAQHEHDKKTLKNAAQKTPDWFRPVDESEEPAPGTSKNGSDRERQWNKLLKSFRNESHKYAKHERGDALGSAYKIACEIELKWRDRGNFDALTVIEKEDYQKDMDRLLHDHDGFVWKVLGSNEINGRDLSISDLYEVISRAEFKNTLRESRQQQMGGVAFMFASAPPRLYDISMGLLSSAIPKVGDLYWYIGARSRQYTIDSLSGRTAKGLELPLTADPSAVAA